MFIREEGPFKLAGPEHSFKKNYLNENSTFHSNDDSIPKTTLHFDNPFPQFLHSLSSYLHKGPYPQSQTLFNPFCPFCLKFLNNYEPFTICSIKSGQVYVIHDKCLADSPSFEMNLVAQQEDDLFVLKSNHYKSVESKPNIRHFALQFREFLVEIIFSHPINEKRFGKLHKKVNSGKQQKSLQVLFSAHEDQYTPNMLVLPLTDFKLEVNIQLIGDDSRSKISKYINFKKIPAHDSKQLIFGNQELQMELSVFESEKYKNKVMEEMNYKYTFSADKSPLLLVKELWLQIPLSMSQENSEDLDQAIESSSSKLLYFLELDGKFDEANSQITRNRSKTNVSFSSINSRKTASRSMKRSLVKSQEVPDHEKVNLEKLIKTDALKSFVKHNTQSRSFQSFLQKANNSELDSIILHMKTQFIELMKHDYGNYMMQKLFSVCNLERKLFILEVLVPRLSDIVMNKQGTHAFQDFLSFLTTDHEYVLILSRIRQNFYELCTHNNATHFVQKIIKVFPIELMNQFFYYCVQNIYQFSCDKNGMCVLKQMLKKLKEVSELNLDQNPKHQERLNLAREYKKLFVQSTLYNLDAIIGDMFGNYVLQFNFELFDSYLTSTLTDCILKKLPQYSLSKYSTNVVYKCLNSYWANNKQYVSSVLKEVFQPYLILEMHKNKDGNKVLLEIMERYEGLQIWNKVFKVLITTEPSRFYHDRWGACMGIRSGNAGGDWSSFSEGAQKLNAKKKNKNLL